MIEPMIMIGILTGVTFVYFIIKYVMLGVISGPNDYVNNQNKTLGGLIIYLIFIFSFQIFFGISNVNEKCNGIAQPITGILYSLGPNILIFGSVVMLLLGLPGWKSAFSNTFGYGFVNALFNVSNSLVDLLKGEGNELVRKICSNKSLVINEMTPSNFIEFVKKLPHKKDYTTQKTKSNNAYNNLWKCIVIKDIIAEFIWYILTLALVVSITYDSIIDIRCNMDKNQLKTFVSKLESDADK